MELYVLDNNDLTTLSILECSSYEINLDNQFTDKSVFRVNKAAGQIKDNFLVVNGLYQQFLFIIDEVETTDKEEKFVNLVCSDISNIFNRKIIQQDIDLMTSRSIEYFLAHTIDVNFINSDDSVLDKSYIEVTYTEQTQGKEATNAENGIYNFHTFLENCREHHNVFTDFKFEDGKLKITIAHKSDSAVIIDTTLPEVTHYNKVYEQDIVAKVQVYVRETDTVLNWYLKTDRTITTNKNDPDRAAGAIEVISVDTLDMAEQEALNVFKGNTYKHLVEFSMSKNSKLVDTTTLYIGRAITIKTPDGIYNSIISAISLDDDNYINYKSGNIRINFIDKLKQDQENYGNKLDVTGGIVKGSLDVEDNLNVTGTLVGNGNATIEGDLETQGAVISPSFESTASSGFKTDQWFNFIHKDNNVSDNWNISNSQYTPKFTVYPETGDTDIKGNLTVGEDIYFPNDGTLKNKYLKPLGMNVGINMASGAWQLLCKVVFKEHNQGEFVNIRIYIGDGNNGRTNQNAYIDLIGQLGWTGNDDGRAGWNAFLHPLDTIFDLNNTKVKVIADSNISYNIWFYTSRFYCRPNYTANVSENVYVTRDFSTSSTEPTGTTCSLSYSMDYGYFQVQEAKVGRWIDSKPLYRQTFRFNNPPAGQETFYNWSSSAYIENSISNVDEIVSVKAYYKRSDNLFQPVPNNHSNPNAWASGIYDISGSGFNFWAGDFYNIFTINYLIVTIEYTKTTD